MFERTFVETGRTSRSWTVLVSFGLQSLFVAFLTLVPLVITDQLPAARLRNFLTAPAPPSAPPPPASVKIVAVIREKAIPRQFDPKGFFAPRSVPKIPLDINDEQLPPLAHNATPGVPGGVPCGQPGQPPCGNVTGGVPWGRLPEFAPPAPAPPPPAKPKEQAIEKPVQRIRVGGNVQQAKLLSQPKPVYPVLAKQARIQGTVRLNAIIGKDGLIDNLQVASGHPLLVPAALEAVRQWRYGPTLLNGEPVEVATQIDVNFTLQ